MASETSQEHFEAGKRFLREDNLDKALRAFEKAYKEDAHNASYMSYYGLCKALRGGQIGLGLELCTRAIKKEFFRAEFYLNLGKIYLAAENKKGAINVFRKGLRFEPRHSELNRLLSTLGIRNRPVLPMLERSNPVNRVLGKFLRKTMPGILKKGK